MKRFAFAGFGVAAATIAIAVVIARHAAGWPIVVFAIAPDLSFLAGISVGLARGQLHPRAVPIYNAVHRYWAPAVLVVITYFLDSPEWLAAGLAWIAHISFDRSLGFGLRNRDGFQRG